MRYDRDPKYLHPFIANKLNAILTLINTGLPQGHIAKLVSIHRTPADQFQLFKQGRVFKNGSWVKTGSIVTNLDGFIKMSNHNYLPCLAIDIGIFNGDKYLGNSPHYASIQQGKQFGLSWGGDWNRFKDLPHLEMTNINFFKHDIKKDNGLLWQRYLQMDGTYIGAMDGIFGENSLKALKETTGESIRSMKAWDKLFDKFGVLRTEIH